MTAKEQSGGSGTGTLRDIMSALTKVKSSNTIDTNLISSSVAILYVVTKFLDLRDDMITLYNKIKTMIDSEQLRLPEYTNLNIHDANAFDQALSIFPEYDNLKSRLVECRSFKKFFDDYKSDLEADDWEESDATHLRHPSWLAVEVIRSFVSDSLKCGDAEKVFKVLSTFFDERRLVTPLKFLIDSTVGIKFDETPVQLDKDVYLSTQIDSGGKHLYLLIVENFKVKLLSDHGESVDWPYFFSEVRKLIGKFIISVYLTAWESRKKRLRERASVSESSPILFNVFGVSVAEYIYFRTWFWPNLSFGDNYMKEETYEWASGLITNPNMRYDKKLEVNVNELVRVWNQLGELAKRVRGLERKIEVIGRRLATQLRDIEDEVINYCILLESILSKEGEKEEAAYRLALRGAILGSADNEEVPILRHFLKELYKARSKIIHGVESYPEPPILPNRYPLKIRSKDKDRVLDIKDKDRDIDLDNFRTVPVPPRFLKSASEYKGALNADEAIADIVRRLFSLALIREELRSWDELIDYVDKAILDEQFRQEISRI